jgi:hypothetical protein
LKRNTNAKPIAPAAAHAPAKPELMPIQQLICDEVADMLIHGGHQSDVESLILAALGHMHMRKYLQVDHKSGQWNDSECRESAEKLIIRDAEKWKADLACAWVENLRATPRPEPIDVVGRIRERVIDELRALFEGFLTEASPEDHTLMREILTYLDGNVFRDDGPRVALAEEFDIQIGRAWNYLKVPERILEDVRQYIKTTMAHPAMAEA